jgi:hypothetical protein
LIIGDYLGFGICNLEFFLGYLSSFLGNLNIGIEGLSRRNVMFSRALGAQGESLGRAGGHAKATTDTPFEIDGRPIIIQVDGLHLASLDTGFAAGAEVLVHLGKVVGLYQAAGMAVKLNGLEDPATTSATTAHPPHFLGIGRAGH